MKYSLLWSISLFFLTATTIVKSDALPSRPYVVGPELYQIHTDAHFFVTRVFVNDVELTLRNAEGNGSSRNSDYRVNGAIGYPNKNYLNAFLRPGDNEVKVVFSSPLLKQMQGKSGELAFIRDMYAHVVINTGELNKGSFGKTSYELDKAIAAPDNKAIILKDKLLRRFSAEKLKEEVSVIHHIHIDAHNALQASDADCEIKLDNNSHYKGKLSLNGNALFDVTDFGEYTTLDSPSALVVTGTNTLTVDVTALNNNKTHTIALQRRCNMDNALKKSNLAQAFHRYDFGSFFNHVYLPFINIDFNKLGTYSATFTNGEE